MDRVELDRRRGREVASVLAPGDVTRAFWGGCHGGGQQVADYLLSRGAELNWIPPWEAATPLDAAVRQRSDDLVRWLRA